MDQDLWQTPISVGAGGAGLDFDLHPDLAALSLCDLRQVSFPSALNFLICIKYQDSAGLPGSPESWTRTFAWRIAATQEISAVTMLPEGAVSQSPRADAQPLHFLDIFCETLRE